jgi:hypothetical protein
MFLRKDFFAEGILALKIEAGRGNFTSFGGLALADKVISGSGLKRRVDDILPASKRISKAKSFGKFKSLLLGFIAGAECLDDMAVLAEDPGFQALCHNKVFIPNTYGSYLRSFQPWQIKKLNNKLRDHALRQRRSAFPQDKKLIVDIDSTCHVQHGKKIEGVGYNYKGEWCLSSLQAFDQYGFQMAMEVREGPTFTSVGVARTVRNIFSHVPKDMHRFMRADSGMCNIDVMNACYEHRVDFVMAMRANMSARIIKSKNFWEWRKGENTYTRDGRECELASAPYFPDGARQCLRVVILRAKKKDKTLFEDGFDYYSFVSNIAHSEMNNEELVAYYQKRGNAENYIRELKNGFDMHHFPCRSLNANKVYGLIAAFAHNIMRFMAPVLNRKQLHFSKKIRFRMIYIGAQVVKKARTWIVRMSNSKFREVDDWLTKIKRQLICSYMSG